MTNPLERIRPSGSFVAGLLIGLSIALATFAMTDPDSSAWRTLLIFGAPLILVLGFTLQVLVTSKASTRAHDERRA
jgi:hypothetical protein